MKISTTMKVLSIKITSESEHTHDENEWEISVIAKDVAIKWEYYDAKNHEIIVSEQHHSII